MNLKMAKEWLNAAKLDLDSINYLIEDEYLTSIVAFHSQQTVEKCFKAILEYNEIKFPKIHSLIRLYQLVKQHIAIEFDEDIIQKLTELYINSRYPGEFGMMPEGRPTREDAEEFYKFAMDVFNYVENKLG